MSVTETQVAAHYARPGLAGAILKGLEAAGADPLHPKIEDLAPVDEFHTAGRITTLKALAMMNLRPGMRVLDAGCGLGGTARVLAGEHDCEVQGLDLTEDYVLAARLLTERMGLSNMCEFRQGSVLDMPYGDGGFDAGVTMHVAMNIEDRESFYAELARVLKPGAELMVFDVMAGAGGAPDYPMPWAQTGDASFLKTPRETQDLLEAAGFQVQARESLQDFAVSFFRKIFASPPSSGPPPLGLHLLTGEDSPTKFANYLAAAESDRVDPVMMLARRG